MEYNDKKCNSFFFFCWYCRTDSQHIKRIAFFLYTFLIFSIHVDLNGSLDGNDLGSIYLRTLSCLKVGIIFVCVFVVSPCS